jgi:hypothetical protein
VTCYPPLRLYHSRPLWTNFGVARGEKAQPNDEAALASGERNEIEEPALTSVRHLQTYLRVTSPTNFSNTSTGACQQHRDKTSEAKEKSKQKKKDSSSLVLRKLTQLTNKR